MGLRSRVVSSVMVGGLMTGALVLGAPAAEALPSVTGTCGGSVTASPGDTIYGPGGVKLGTAGQSSGPVTGTVSGLLGLVSCTVNVTVKAASSAVGGAASGAASGVKSGTGAVGGAVSGATGGLKGATTPSASAGGTRTTTAAAAPSSTAAPAPGAAAAGAAAPATLADAPLSPAFVPMFAGLPSSFLAAAAPGASAVSAIGSYDPSLLLGGAPAYRLAIPSLLGDPATAVTTASQLQALPIDGLGGGFGVPAVLAVLVAAGAAAFGVRRAILGRRVLPGRPELSRLLHRRAGGGTASA